MWLYSLHVRGRLISAPSGVESTAGIVDQAGRRVVVLAQGAPVERRGSILDCASATTSLLGRTMMNASRVCATRDGDDDGRPTIQTPADYEARDGCEHS